ILLLISALFTLIASIIAWRRSMPGSFALSLLLFSMTIWSFFYALHWLPIPAAFKPLVPNIIYLGVVAVPSLFLIFSLSFTNHGEWSNRRLIFALAIEPVVTWVLAWTNNYHHLVFQSIRLVNQNDIAWLQ